MHSSRKLHSQVVSKTITNIICLLFVSVVFLHGAESTKSKQVDTSSSSSLSPSYQDLQKILCDRLEELLTSVNHLASLAESYDWSSDSKPARSSYESSQSSSARQLNPFGRNDRCDVTRVGVVVDHLQSELRKIDNALFREDGKLPSVYSKRHRHHLMKATSALSRLATHAKSQHSRRCLPVRAPSRDGQGDNHGQNKELDQACDHFLKSLVRLSGHAAVSLSRFIEELGKYASSKVMAKDVNMEGKPSSHGNEKEMMMSDDGHVMLGDGPKSYPMEYEAVDQSQQYMHRDGQSARTYSQYFDTSSLERFLGRCTNCVEQSNSHTCPLNNQVLEMKKWAGQLQELLSFGCQSAATCGTSSRCCISNQEPFAVTVVQMTQMLKDVYNMMLKSCRTCADAQSGSASKSTSQWSDWSQCQRNDDGAATRRRRRSSDCGPGSSASCVAEEVQSEPCPTPPTERCCYPGQWTRWSEYTACSASCGQGIRRRIRRCNKMLPNTVCSDDIPDRPDSEIETAQCEDLPSCDPEILEVSVRWDESRCDCKTGLSLCESLIPARGRAIVSAQDCERALGYKDRCANLEQQCPVCVSSCKGKARTTFPSCTGCNHYIRCDGDASPVFRCKDIDGQRSEYNAITGKCEPGVSPTCRLGEQLSDCSRVGRPDSFYHTSSYNCSEYVSCRAEGTSLQSCTRGLEFDLIQMTCLGSSTTCPRRVRPFEVDDGAEEPVGALPGLPGLGSGNFDQLFRREHMGIIIGGVLD